MLRTEKGPRRRDVALDRLLAQGGTLLTSEIEGAHWVRDPAPPTNERDPGPDPGPAVASVRGDDRSATPDR